jgi:hypothetical protein
VAGVKKYRIVRILEIILTFHLVCFAWIFFRANTLGDAFYVAGNLLVDFKLEWSNRWGLTYMNLLMIVFAIAVLIIVQIIQQRMSISGYLAKYPLLVRYLVYSGLIILIFTMGLFTKDEFIYFQF